MFNDKDKIFKKIIIVIIILIVWILGIFIVSSFLEKWNVEVTEEIEVVTKKTDDQIAKEALFEIEMNKYISFLNRWLANNYLKIEKYKKTSKIKLSTKDKAYIDENPNIEFFMFKIGYNMSEDNLADFDIYINHGSTSVLEYKKKSWLWKKQVKIKLEQYYKDNFYDILTDSILYWYIEYVPEINTYKIWFIWDYMYKTFSKEQWLTIDDVSDIAILQDYLNFWKNFLSLDKKELYSKIKWLKNKTKNKNFKLFISKMEIVYFKDLIK